MSTYEIECERYQQEAEYWSRYEAAIEAEKDDLMAPGGECDPHDGENFFKALAEDPYEGDVKEVSELLSKEKVDFDDLGRLVYEISIHYWDRKAESRAAEILEEAVDD